MQVLRRIFSAFGRVNKRRLAVTFVLVATMAIGLGLAARGKTSAISGSCDTNDIMACGASSPSEYIQKLQQNSSGDLQNIALNFTPDFHLAPNEYDSFAATARPGLAYKDGRVIVDGQVVMTDGWSIGRDSKSYAWKYTLPGSNSYYWASHSQDVFLSPTIPVMVYFGDDGAAQFVVMNSCGNLMAGNKVVPQFDCKMLNQLSTGEKNTYDFNVTVAHSDNVSVDKIVYDFGDGQTKLTKSPDEKVRHTFTKVGDNIVTATVTFNLPGGAQKTVPPINCVKHITVAAPPPVVVQSSSPPPAPTPAPAPAPAPAPSVGKELPNTGAGSIAGIFTGVSALGAVAHRVITRRRR